MNSDKLSISVRNYQSIVKADIELENGITVVTGKTMAGKSALIRALDESFFNRGDDDKVKSGSRYSGVSVSNGKHKFAYRRDSHGKNEKTAYQIDGGDLITKVGRGQLEEISKLFNIVEVRLANNTKEKLNFWLQGEPAFLTNKTDGQLFDFLSQSSCDKYIKVANKLEKDLKSMRAEIAQINNTVDVLKSINNDKQEMLDRNEGYDKIYSMAVRINRDVSSFNRLEGVVLKALADIAKVRIKMDKLGVVDNLLCDIDMDRLSVEWRILQEESREFDSLVGMLKGVRSEKDKLINRQKDLDRVDVTLGRMDGCDDIEEEIRRLEDLEGIIISMGDLIKGKSVKEGEVLKKKEVAERINNIIYEVNSEDIEKRIRVISEIDEEIKQIDPIMRSYGELMLRLVNKERDVDSIPEYESVDLDSIGRDISDISCGEDEIRRLGVLIKEVEEKEKIVSDRREKISSVDGEILKAEKEFEEFKKEVGYCPYCNSVLGESCSYE